MGLGVEVGYLAGLLANDEDGAASFRGDMANLNEYLASIGLPPHCEPEECEIFSRDLYGYSGLHYLRRIAAHLDLRGNLPLPGGKNAPKDEVMEEYYRIEAKPEAGFLGRLFRKPPRPLTFDHLLLHSDAEGYYLPQDFAAVLFPPKKFAIPGGGIGSSFRLQDECKRLAAALRLPLDLDPESEEVYQATESQGQGDVHWKRYGIESYVCLRLYQACALSLKHQAAIVFC